LFGPNILDVTGATPPGLTSIRLPTLFGFRGSTKRFIIFPQVPEGAIDEAAELPLQLPGVAAVFG
jgi:hypothetical protein